MDHLEAHLTGARRASARLGMAAAAACTIAGSSPGCYQPRPLDGPALLAELRRAELGGAGAPRAGARASSGAGAGREGVLYLDEDRAIAVALVSNRSLRALRLERGVAAGEVIAAGAIANPAVRLELTHLQVGTPSGFGWGLGLAWEPPQPEVRGAHIAAARAHREEVEHDIAEHEWAVASDARVGFAELSTVDEEARLTDEAVTVRKRLLALVEALVQGGGATRFDQDLAALAEADAERLRADKVRERRQVQARLAGLLGLAPGTSVAVPELDPPSSTSTSPPASTAAGCSGSALEARAIDTRPLLAASAARYKAAEQVVRQQIAARWPWIRLSAVPRVRRNEIFGQTTDIVFGVDVTVPIFDWNTGAIRAAQAASDRSRAEWVAELDNVRHEISAACADREDQAALLRLHRERLGPLLIEHDRLMAQAFSARQLDLTALVAAEQRVLEDRLLLARSKLGLRLASIALDRAVGARLRAGADGASGQE